MRVWYKIEKRHGLYRPKLTIGWEWTEEELSLNPLPAHPFSVPLVHCLDIYSRMAPGDITKGADRCSNPTFEKVLELERLDRPGHLTCCLPWRPTDDYPEVEEAVKAIRDELERALLQAAEDLPFEVSGELEMTPRAKMKLAPILAALKLDRSA